MPKTRFIGPVKDGAAKPFYSDENNPHVLFFEGKEGDLDTYYGINILWATSCTKPANALRNIVRSRLASGEYDYIDLDVFNAAFPLNKIVVIDEKKIPDTAVEIKDNKPAPASPFDTKFPSVSNRYIGIVTDGKTRGFSNGSYVIDTATADFDFLYNNGCHQQSCYENHHTGRTTKWTLEKLNKRIKENTYAYLTPEEFYAQFKEIAEKPAPVLTKYIGIKNYEGGYEPFSGSVDGVYAFDISGDKPSFIFANGKVQTETGWGKASVQDSLNSKYYGYLTQETFDKHFTKTKTVIAAPTPAPKTMASSFVISKGKLYFNQTTKQVERVLTILDGALIWTSRHKQEAKPYGKSTFRLATDAEVQNYLAEASANSN